MPPVVSTLLAFVLALLRSRQPMQLEILALRHQLWDQPHARELVRVRRWPESLIICDVHLL